MIINKPKCGKCGHTWLPRVDRPMACPRCKNYLKGNHPRRLKKTSAEGRPTDAECDPSGDNIKG